MDGDKEENRHVDVELSYGKLSGKIFGVNTNWFLGLAILIICAWLGWIQFSSVRAADNKEHEEMATAIKNISVKMEEGQKKTQESVREMTYVLTLSQKARENLRLDMPDSLKRRTYSIGREKSGN